MILVHNLRDYTHDRHRSTDDEPFGPGAGMVMKPEPVFEAVETIRREAGFVKSKFVVTPQGECLPRGVAQRLAEENHLIIIAGITGGVDERIREHLVDQEISIGDYVPHRWGAAGARSAAMQLRG